jgi:hypothetical protein
VRKQDSDRSHPTSGYDVAQTIASGASLDRPIFGQQRSRVGGWPIAATVAVLAVILYAVRYALLPFVFAMAIAFVTDPLIKIVQRRLGAAVRLHHHEKQHER